MQNLTSVSSLGFALPCGMNHLSEICIVNCAYEYGSGAFSSIKSIDGPHLLQLLFEHPHPKLRKVRFAGCAGLTEAHLENLHQQYGVIDFDLFTCHQCQEMSAIQSQCTMQGCQPSTIALCSECSQFTNSQFTGEISGDETRKCDLVGDCCGKTGCSSCTNQYIGWVACESGEFCNQASQCNDCHWNSVGHTVVECLHCITKCKLCNPDGWVSCANCNEIDEVFECVPCSNISQPSDFMTVHLMVAYYHAIFCYTLSYNFIPRTTDREIHRLFVIRIPYFVGFLLFPLFLNDSTAPNGGRENRWFSKLFHDFLAFARVTDTRPRAS